MMLMTIVDIFLEHFRLEIGRGYCCLGGIGCIGYPQLYANPKVS